MPLNIGDLWSPIQLLAMLDLMWFPIQLLTVLNLIWSPIQLLPVLDLINDICRESDCVDKFDLLTPLMTFDPKEKIHMYTGKMHCSNSNYKFLLCLVLEIKIIKLKTGNDPCDPIWPLIN